MPPWIKLSALERAVVVLAVCMMIAANHYVLELASRASG